MRIDDFVRLHQTCGFKIKKIEGHYFLKRGLINYAFPPLLPCKVTKKLINRLRWKYLISVIKTESPIKNSHEYILRTDDYTVEMFPHRTRTTVRKSMKSCVFRRPSLADLQHQGLRINRQTLKFQKRKDKFLTDPQYWDQYIGALFSNKDSTIMGAYSDEKMIGFAVAYELEKKHYFDIQHIDRDYGTNYPMSGLMYNIINQLIENNGTTEISDGIESLKPLPSLNKFKRYMRFERVPITRVYVLHPLLSMAIKVILFVAIQLLGKRNFKKNSLRQIVSIYNGCRLLSKIVSKNPAKELSAGYVILRDSSK